MQTVVTILVFVFGASAMQGFFLSIPLIATKQGNRNARFWLAALLVIFSYNVLYYFLYYHQWLVHFPHLIFTNMGMLLLIGPLFYLFATHSLHPRSTAYTDFLHFIPWVANMAWMISFFLLPADAKLQSLERMAASNNQQPHNLISISILLFTMAQIATYALLSFRVYQRFRQQEKTNAVVVRQFKKILFAFTAFALVAIVYQVGGLFHLPFDNPVCYVLKFLMIVPIYSVAYMAILQPGQLFASPTVQKYRNSPLSSNQAQQVLVQVKAYFEKNKPYLDSEWSISRLAHAMELPSSYLSQAINEGCGYGFNDLVNEYRVNEAKTLLEADAKTPVIDIAYQCGFGNKVTFYAAFKKITGLTPTAYREQNEKIVLSR